MGKENIEFSKDGLKTTLLTFISNHATSLIVLTFFVIAYYYPIFGERLETVLSISLSLETKIFFAALLFLLLHPLGLIIDVLSWILLGWMEKSMETYHFKNNTPFTKGTRYYLCFETLKQKHNLDSNNFYERVRQFEYSLITNYPDVRGELDFYLGSSVLFRNLTLCSIIIAFVFFFLCCWCAGLITLIFTILFILINSCVSFYYSLNVLMLFSKISERPSLKNRP